MSYGPVPVNPRIQSFLCGFYVTACWVCNLPVIPSYSKTAWVWDLEAFWTLTGVYSDSLLHSAHLSITVPEHRAWICSVCSSLQFCFSTFLVSLTEWFTSFEFPLFRISEYFLLQNTFILACSVWPISSVWVFGSFCVFISMAFSFPGPPWHLCMAYFQFG